MWSDRFKSCRPDVQELGPLNWKTPGQRPFFLPQIDLADKIHKWPVQDTCNLGHA